MKNYHIPFSPPDVPLQHCPEALRGTPLNVAASGDEPKQAQAQEAIKTFQELGIDLSGLKILDIGCGLGYHTKALCEAGANAYAVEPNKAALEQAISEGHVECGKAYASTLQAIPLEAMGTFDAAAVFCYNIPFNEREGFFKALAGCLTEKGIALIGVVSDEEREYLGDSSASIKPYLEQYFGKHEQYCTNGVNATILKLSEPRSLWVSRQRATAPSQQISLGV